MAVHVQTGYQQPILQDPQVKPLVTAYEKAIFNGATAPTDRAYTGAARARKALLEKLQELGVKPHIATASIKAVEEIASGIGDRLEYLCDCDPELTELVNTLEQQVVLTGGANKPQLVVAKKDLQTALEKRTEPHIASAMVDLVVAQIAGLETTTSLSR